MKTRIAILTLTAALGLSACTHTPSAPATPPPAKHVDKSIGTATMLTDGTIVLEMRTSMDTGSGTMTQKIKPTDMQYASTLKQIGGLKPGQTKSIDEYPVQ